MTAELMRDGPKLGSAENARRIRFKYSRPRLRRRLNQSNFRVIAGDSLLPPVNTRNKVFASREQNETEEPLLKRDYKEGLSAHTKLKVFDKRYQGLRCLPRKSWLRSPCVLGILTCTPFVNFY